MNKKFMLLGALVLTSLTFVAADSAAGTTTTDTVVTTTADGTTTTDTALTTDGFVKKTKDFFVENLTALKSHTLDWATAKTAEHPVKAILAAMVFGGVVGHYAVPAIQGWMSNDDADETEG